MRPQTHMNVDIENICERQTKQKKELDLSAERGLYVFASYVLVYLKAKKELQMVNLSGMQIGGAHHYVSEADRESDARSKGYLPETIRDTSGIKALCEFANSNRNLEHLNITKTNLIPNDIELLFASLSTQSGLREIVVDANHIGLDGAKAIAAFLEKNPNITFLSLENCFLKEEAMITIISSLNKNKNLLRLSLRGNPITRKVMSSLAAMLINNSTLTEILFDRLHGEEERLGKIITKKLLRNGAYWCILRELHSESFARTIDFHDLQIGYGQESREGQSSSSNVAALCGLLEKNREILYFDLSNTGLVATDFKLILSALSKKTLPTLPLRALSFSFNQVGNARQDQVRDSSAMDSLVGFLSKSSSLQSLKLESCNLGYSVQVTSSEPDAKQISDIEQFESCHLIVTNKGYFVGFCSKDGEYRREALPEHKEVLAYIKQNLVGQKKGVVQDSIVVNYILKFIASRGGRISYRNEKSMLSLVSSLKKNAHLRHLDLRGNALTQQVFLAIDALLEGNQVLTDVLFDAFFIDSSLAKSIEKKLKRNLVKRESLEAALLSVESRREAALQAGYDGNTEWLSVLINKGHSLSRRQVLTEEKIDFYLTEYYGKKGLNDLLDKYTRFLGSDSMDGIPPGPISPGNTDYLGRRFKDMLASSRKEALGQYMQHSSVTNSLALVKSKDGGEKFLSHMDDLIDPIQSIVDLNIPFVRKRENLLSRKKECESEIKEVEVRLKRLQEEKKDCEKAKPEKSQVMLRKLEDMMVSERCIPKEYRECYEVIAAPLAKEGVNPDFTDPKSGDTFLQCMIKAGKEEVVATLLKYGADPLLANSKQETAWSIAFEQKGRAIFMVLLDRLINVSTGDLWPTKFSDFIDDDFQEIEKLKKHLDGYSRDAVKHRLHMHYVTRLVLLMQRNMSKRVTELESYYSLLKEGVTSGDFTRMLDEMEKTSGSFKPSFWKLTFNSELNNGVREIIKELRDHLKTTNGERLNRRVLRARATLEDKDLRNEEENSKAAFGKTAPKANSARPNNVFSVPEEEAKAGPSNPSAHSMAGRF